MDCCIVPQSKLHTKSKKPAAKTAPVKSRKEKDQEGTSGASVQPPIVL
jgi:hypothetical protein